ncbi:MAG: sensor histidine kinase [Candidatus Limnocylindrales bacterium]
MAGKGRAHGNGANGDARLLRRVRLRLVFWSGLITFAIVLALGLLVYASVATSLANAGRDQLAQRTAPLGELLRRAGDPDQAGRAFPIGFALGGSTSGTYAIIVQPNDTVIGPREAAFPGLPIDAGVSVARSGSADYRELELVGLPARVLSTPVDLAGQTYVVQVIGDRTADVRTLEILLVVLTAGGALAVLLALVGGTLYAQRALVPIRESLRRQREFAADASHELRTPLAVVRGNLEHLQRHPQATVASMHETVDDARAEVDHMTELVESLLLLARADSGVLELEQVPVDLADVAAGALGGLDPLAQAREVPLVHDATPALVQGDPTRLRQLVTILADNAVRHSPPGGEVAVAVHVEGKRAELTVDDAGPGIRAEDKPHLFERFWRAPDAPEGGIGLGLSIAAWIAERHGGSIVAGTSPAGGARFTVSLPLQAEGAP